jgi:PKD repeat protein
MRLLKSNPSGRLFLVFLMVITACLLIPGALAASATADQQINDKGYSGVGPIVNFTTDPAAANGVVSITIGQSVKFTDNSAVNITARQWDFADGSTSAESSPSHTFDTVGNYSITLGAWNATGYASNVSGQTVGVYTLPYVNVSPVVKPSTLISGFNVSLNGKQIGDTVKSTADITNVNVNDVLTFTDNTTPAATGWSWNFGDASPIVNTNTTNHTFTQDGTYTVLFTPSNSNGAGAQVSIKIVVGGLTTPVSSFSATDASSSANTLTAQQLYGNGDFTTDANNKQVLNGTAPLAVHFTDKSTKSPAAWNWSINGTQFSSTANADHTFPQGNYLVVLNVTNAAANGFNTSYVWVNSLGPEAPVGTIEANVTTGASPLAVRLNTTWDTKTTKDTQIPTSYLWNFGDGTQGSTDRNVTHVFTATADTDYTVTLVTRNGFGPTTAAPVTVHVTKTGAAVADFTINGTTTDNGGQYNSATAVRGDLVVGNPIFFNDTYTEGTGIPTAYSWVFSDGKEGSSQKDVVRTFTTPGIYWVYHTATNSANGNVQDTGIKFGQAATWYKLNIFEVKAQATPPTVTAPVASFNIDPASPAEGPVKVNFTNTSSNGPTTFQWLINGQQVGVLENLTYTFPSVTADTKYVITLVAGNSAGNNAVSHDFTVKAITGKAPSNFSFAAPNGLEAPATVQFTADVGNATSYFWNFDDGATSTEQNPQHIFQTVGSYSVKLTTTNLAGSNSTTRSVVTTDLGTPKASFTANAASVSKDVNGNTVVSPALAKTKAPFTVQFNGTTLGRVSAYYWDLGDGTTAQTANVNHTYSTPGNYSVYLIVANTQGSDYVYASQLISVSAPDPTADFTATPSTGAAPLNVQFTDTTGNNPFAWYWTFGDGTISGAQNPTHTYNTAGTYPVTLTAQNSVGTSKKTMNITVIKMDKPVSNFTFAPTTGQAPLTVQFNDTSSNSPSSWSWTFTDDLSTSNVQNPVHTFKSAGSYVVILTATNAAGAGNMCLLPITVTAAPVITPVADFTATPTTGVAPLSVQFADKSTNADVWVWTFGDGATSTLQNPPAHTYTAAGTYTVQLQAVNSTSSKSNTASKTITVTAAPQTLQAAFNVNAQAVALGTAVTGTDASTGYPATWSWDFGDGFTASSQNINHIYGAVGNYTLSLTVTNGTQTSTASKTITVSTVPTTTTTTITPTQGHPYNGPHNAPGTVQAEDYDLGGQNVAYYDTTAGNAGGAYRSDDVDIEAGASGYAVAYVIGGEYLTYSVDAATAGDYTVSLSAANPDASAKQIQLTTLGNSATTVSVASTGSFDTYNSFTSAGTLHLEQGRNVVKVAFGASRMNLDYITIGGGVTPTTTVTTQPTTTVTTQPTTGAASFTVSPTSGRHSLSVALADTTTGGNPVSWKWNCGNGQTFSGQNIGLNRIWYNNAGTYTITLTVTDANGSTRTATHTVTVS